MRKAEFEVPAELMPDFTMELVKSGLNHSLTGVTKDDEIIVEVQYKRDEMDTVNELEEALDDLIEEQGQDDDED